MSPQKRRLLVTVVGIGIAGFLGWYFTRPKALPSGFTSSNGRIEAVTIDIATVTAGRVMQVLVNEGDFISTGQVLAQMDTNVLNAQLREAQAELLRAKTNIDAAKSTVTQRESEKASAESVVLQREAEFDLATKNFARAEDLVEKKVLTKEDFDTNRASLYSAKAAVSTAKANVSGADAAIANAKSRIIEAEAAVGAAQAKIERLQADLDDCTLKSPRNGRVQYRIAEPGEVLNAGGKVLNMVDLADVYMTFFLPTTEAGRVQMETEIRIVLDAAPHLVIPAQVTLVADVAQFTPKTVETAVERQKLMFRIKAHIDPALLKKHIRSVKTGLPGMAYVRLDPNAEWPENLRIRLPE